MKLTKPFHGSKCISWSELAGHLQQVPKLVWDKILVCSTGSYRRLPSTFSGDDEVASSSAFSGYDSDSDFISLKICVLGDCQTGKTSFVNKYVGVEELETRCLETKGLNLTDKLLLVGGAKIVFSIWDVGGAKESRDQVPLACKDALAILFMFDLTSRCTLNSLTEWYNEARKWNQTAIPILVGTKFDDFAKLPIDLQWTIMTQARGYTRAMKATLFFSSSTHNINVNKIFKFVIAKLFNLAWSVERNLTPGEPIIDY